MASRKSPRASEDAAAAAADRATATARTQASRARALGLVAAVGWAAGVSATTPFSVAADVLVALPIALIGFVVAVQIVRPERPNGRAANAGHVWRHREWIPWAAAVLVVVVFELYSYLATPRAAHPTLSSLEDTLARSQAGKAALVLAWLLLGWYLVRLPLERRGRGTG